MYTRENDLFLNSQVTGVYCLYFGIALGHPWHISKMTKPPQDNLISKLKHQVTDSRTYGVFQAALGDLSLIYTYTHQCAIRYLALCGRDNIYTMQTAFNRVYY